MVRFYALKTPLLKKDLSLTWDFGDMFILKEKLLNKTFWML
jgi:hypothetical protein